MGDLSIITKPQTITTMQKALVTGKNFLINQSPIILAGAAVGGVITTSVLVARGSIRASDLIKEAETAKKDTLGADASLTIQEKIQAGWKPIFPAIISGGLTIGAIIASTTISQKRQTALAGLYALSETALKEYQDKLEQKLGPKDAQKIRDEINSDRVKNAGTPPWDDSVLPAGQVLCYDKFIGRYFASSVQELQTAENQVNKMIYGGDMCASLNEFYSFIKDDRACSCGFGDEVGWNLDADCKLYFTSCLTSDMKPCLVVDWSCGHEPSPRYQDI